MTGIAENVPATVVGGAPLVPDLVPGAEPVAPVSYTHLTLPTILRV